MTRDLQTIAETLDRAESSATLTEQLDTDLSIDEAYAIQSRILSLHQERGERYAGPKLGFTSKAKMEQMGVSNIIVGFLTDAMQCSAGGTLSLNGLIHPRIEPELVFGLKDEVAPRDDEDAASLAERIRAATDRVAPGLEIIDSRYRDFKFSFSDVVADNTSAARFVVGAWQEFPRDLRGLDVEFRVDGDVVETSTTDAILGDPMEAFSQLAEMVLAYGFALPAGAVILGGSMTAAVHLHPGQSIEARVAGFEPVTLNIEK